MDKLDPWTWPTVVIEGRDVAICPDCGVLVWERFVHLDWHGWQ